MVRVVDAAAALDGYPGGVGLCREACARIDELLLAAHEAIVSCDCETGCPSCVHSPKCGSGNRPIDKEAARLVLEGLLAGDEQRLEVMKEKAEAAAGPDEGLEKSAPVLPSTVTVSL